MSFSESVATNLLESGIKTCAPNGLFPCVIVNNNTTYRIPVIMHMELLYK